MIDEQLRQQLRDLVGRPNARRGLSCWRWLLCGPRSPIRDDFTIGYRCTGFQFDL